MPDESFSERKARSGSGVIALIIWPRAFSQPSLGLCPVIKDDSPEVKGKMKKGSIDLDGLL